MTTHPKVDVVTLGAGWTASILAWKLGAAGYDTVSLEQGPARFADPDFQHNHDSLRYSVRKSMMVNLAKETWTWRPNPKATSLPIRRYGAFHPGAGLGGASVHWSAQLWRFMPSDFQYRSHHVDRYGESKIPDGCTVQDWGITYNELEPYYDIFEYDLGASGNAGNLNGQIIEGGNPFEGPRSRPYPLPPLATTQWQDLFNASAAELGHHPFPQPSGILSRGYTDATGRPRSACVYCGFCTRFGCEVDAKSSAITTHVPLALDTGRWTVRGGCHVLHINTADDGRATGITYVDEDGEEHVQPADVVIVTGYTLANVRTLLLSSSPAHPGGIGNDRGRLGRNMSYQMYRSPANGLFSDRKFRSYAANTSTLGVIFDYNGDNFDHGDLDFIGGAMIYSSPGEREPVAGAGGLGLYDSHKAAAPDGTGIDDDNPWGPAFKEALRDWDRVASVLIQAESLTYQDQFFDLDPNYKDAWGLPLLRLTFDWHDNDRASYRFLAQRCKEIMNGMGPSEMSFEEELSPFSSADYNSTHVTGGAIMGTDPGTSVCNSYGQVWDTPNVFVAGAALFPQNPGANPSGTLAALAYRTGDALVQRYFKDPNELITSAPRRPIPQQR